MKRIISIIAAAVLLAGCAANSGKTPMPPAWALGFWTIADRNTDADDIAEGVSALRNAERPADAFVIGAGSASGFSSTHSLESIHKLDARVAVDLRGKPEGYWKRVMKKFNADTWIVDNPVDAEQLAATGWVPTKLVSNLPYQVAATLILDVLQTMPSVERLVVMVQAEVADRIAAAPGSKAYGAYTAKLALYGEVTGRFEVGPHNFAPPPHVNSAVVRIDRRESPCEDPDKVAQVIDAVG